jgi:Prophage tail length tape measure protein
MTDVAALGVRVDSDGVLTADKALDAFAASADRASASADKVENAGKRGASGARELGSGAKAAQAALDALEMAEKATSARSVELATTMQRAGQSLKFTRLEGLNFSRQFADIGVTAAMGMNPLLIAIQQGPQLLDIFQNKAVMAGTTVGTVMKAAGAQVYAAMAPLAPIIALVTAAAGALALGVGLVTSEINKTTKVTVTWQDVVLGAFDVVKAAISERVTAAFKAMGLDIGGTWDDVVRYTRKAVNLMIGASLALPQLIRATYAKLPAAFGDAFYSAANLAIRALNELARMSAAPLNSIIEGFNGAFGTSIPRIVMGGISEIANPYAGGMAALGKAGAASLVKSFTTDYIGETASVLSEAAQKRARLRKAAEKGGSDLGGAAGRAAGQALGKALEAEAAESLVDALSKASMEEFYKDFLAARAQEWEDFNNRVNNTVNDRIETQRAADAAATQALNDELERTIGLLEGMGTAGGALAGLVAIATGKTGSLTGPAGALLNIGVSRTDAEGRKIASTIGKEISEVFKGDGPFAKTMTSVLQGVGTGASIGSALFSRSQAAQFGSVAGGALGDVAGEKFLAKGLEGITKGLDDFAGPLGSILGSVAGGLLGGLLNPNRSASANITGLNSIAVSGKDRGNYAAAGDLASSVTAGLKQIADAFGATVGAFQVAIGTRGDQIKVNTNGTSLKAKNGAVGFGEDAEAAARYAILDAIKDGALAGMREGAKRLLEAGDDLDTALQNALSFNSVFDQLEQIKDPTGFALKALDKEFQGLRTIFDQAGASAAEYAQLEELYGIKRAEAMKQTEQANDALDLARQKREYEAAYLRMTGDEIGALNIERALEREQLDASLHALYDRNAAMADEIARQQQATAAAQAANEIEKARSSLRIEILEEQGRTEEALALRRQQQRAETNALLQSDLDLLFAAQDAARAVAEHAAATQAANEIEKARTSLRIELLEAQGRTEEALALTREQQLANMDPLLHALQKQVWATRDLADASEKAAAAAEAEKERGRQAAEEAARKAEQIARQRSDMEIQLLRLQGKEAEALMREQAMLLKDLDPSLHALQKMIWEEERLAKIREEAAKKVEDARSVLSDAYQRESSALQATIDKFKDLRTTLAEFREGLFASEGIDTFLALQGRLAQTSRLANTGQEAALRDLPKVAQDFLNAAYERSTSRSGYQLELARVAAMVDQAIGSADAVVDYNELNLQALNKSVDGLIDIKEEVVSVREAIKELRKAIADADENNQSGQNAIAKNTGDVARAALRDALRPAEVDA